MAGNRVLHGCRRHSARTLQAARDTEAYLAYLDTRYDVRGPKVGAVGFCMGGGMAIVSAGAYPERFVAVASFHGGNLVTTDATSPHLSAKTVKAELYVAAEFERSLKEHGVCFQAKTFPAAHGWMVPDFPVHDRSSAEQGWRELFELFGRTL